MVSNTKHPTKSLRKWPIAKRSVDPLATIALVGCLLVCGALAGCGSVQQHRARQWQREFHQFPKEGQARLLTGHFRKGDSSLALYIALGQPRAIVNRFNGDCDWIYWGLADQPVGPDGPSFRSLAAMVFPSHASLRQLTVTVVDGHIQAWSIETPDPRYSIPSLVRLPDWSLVP